MSALPIFLIVLVLACAGTGLARLYALRQTVMDHPNERSLHSVATPRGGGIAITALGALRFFQLNMLQDYRAFYFEVGVAGGGRAVVPGYKALAYIHAPGKANTTVHNQYFAVAA